MKFGLLNKCVGCPIPLLVDFEHVTAEMAQHSRRQKKRILAVG
jgi:hypothetical protein